MNPIDKKHQEVLRQVGDKARRKRHAQRDGQQSVWGGLGMFGLIGWSVVVPTVAGAGLGIWLDQHHPQSFSWTLSLLILGLFAGCLLAWQWVNKEHDEINKEKDE